jgi:cyclic pyranopterin phosphate synthase
MRQIQAGTMQKPTTITDPNQHQYRLVDQFGRYITYLRISVTDRCDFRCTYCMSSDMQFLPRSRILTLEETAQIAKAFNTLGVSKIRITGGEPLVRRNVLWLFNQLGQLPLRELVVTTNGSQLQRYATALRDAGVSRINISLDSLDPQRFRAITRVGNLSHVLNGIDTALNAGFKRLKINSVILKNRNHDEVGDLVQFAIDRNMDVSFIEEMPLGDIDDHDRMEMYYASDELLRDLGRHYNLIPSKVDTGGPSRYFNVEGTDTHVGLISPHSHNFCASCNRVRLTADGKLLLCLGQEHSVDLKEVVRRYPNNTTRLQQAIKKAMPMKPYGHEFNLNEQTVILRHMNVTGG